MLVRGKYILTAADPEEVRNGALRVQNGIITEIDDWNLQKKLGVIPKGLY